MASRVALGRNLPEASTAMILFDEQRSSNCAFSRISFTVCICLFVSKYSDTFFFHRDSKYVKSPTNSMSVVNGLKMLRSKT